MKSKEEIEQLAERWLAETPIKEWGGVENGYIKVKKFKDKYNCSDGNHRHSILLDIYGPDKIIDVVCDGITYNN